MHTVLNVFLIILTIVVVLLAVLYFVGRRLQKKQAVQQEQMEAAKQTVSMLVIDKKKLKMKEAGLPQMVLDSTPKIMRRTKLPIVKAKVGPRIMTFIADARVFEMIPVKKEVKATISGLYITDVKGVRGTVLETPKAKEGFFKRMKNKVTGKDKKAKPLPNPKLPHRQQNRLPVKRRLRRNRLPQKIQPMLLTERNQVPRKRRKSKKNPSALVFSARWIFFMHFFPGADRDRNAVLRRMGAVHFQRVIDLQPDIFLRPKNRKRETSVPTSRSPKGVR